MLTSLTEILLPIRLKSANERQTNFHSIKANFARQTLGWLSSFSTSSYLRNH